MTGDGPPSPRRLGHPAAHTGRARSGGSAAGTARVADPDGRPVMGRSEQDKQKVYRDAVKDDRRNYESGQAHDQGVADRTRKAIQDEARKN